MKSLVGEIGKLYLGEQIGGFKGWTVIQTPLNTKVKCAKYWLFKPYKGKCEAEFYTLFNGRLKFVCKVEVEVDLKGELNKYINNPIELNCGRLDWLKC
jgi:hypothetical protein